MCQSEKIGKITEALVKAQAKIGHASKGSVNPHFKSKYADLASVIDTVKGPLNDEGIAFSQSSRVDDNGRVTLVTMLSHTSGEWLQSHYPLRPAQETPQGFGSALTYARRYCLAAIVGIASEEDDDGNEATKPQAPSKPLTAPPKTIGELEAGALSSLIKATGTDVNKVLASYRATSLSALTLAQADDLKVKLRAKPVIEGQ